MKILTATQLLNTAMLTGFPTFSFKIETSSTPLVKLCYRMIQVNFSFVASKNCW